jgi:hypothetical protein
VLVIALSLSVWLAISNDESIRPKSHPLGTSLVVTRAEVRIMKKLIVGLMGLMLMGVMALPTAAQGRKWNRDIQTTYFRRDNNQRNDFGFSRRDNDQRNDRFDMERRSQYGYDNFGRRNRWEQRDGRRQLNVGSLLNLFLRHR